MRVVFLDRDGTIIADPPDEVVDRLDKVQLFPDTIEALRQLASLDYGVVLITNQIGIAAGRLNEQEFWSINDQILQQLAPSGIKILKTYMCPHRPEDHCECRKPKPTLLLQAAREFGIDMANSWMVGDRPTDIQAGAAAGARTIFVETANIKTAAPTADFTAPRLVDAVQHIAAS